MKKFFSDGLDTIVKLMVTQLGLMIFSMTLALFSRVINYGENVKNMVLLATSVFSILLYLFILYNHVWEKGGKDRIKVDGGRDTKNLLRGLWYSLCANSINIILAIVICCTYYFCDMGNDLESLVGQAFGISHTIARFIQSMYLGFLNMLAPLSSPQLPISFFILPLPAIIVSTLGYILGFNNFKFFKNSKKH